MPKIVNSPKSTESSVPRVMKPYLFHGVYLEPPSGGSEQVSGNCPFCGRDGKFSLNVNTDQWRCFVCNVGSDNGGNNGIGGGNIYTFLRLLWSRSHLQTNDYTDIMKSRKLLDENTLERWGVCRSVLTKDWIVPAYNTDGNLCQLYRYNKDHKTGKYRLLATPELTHQIHMVGPEPDLHKMIHQVVYVCEGPWDAMALWETLRRSAHDSTVPGGVSYTETDELSVLKDELVVAVPGCNASGELFEKLAKSLGDRTVILMFDSDHPISNNGSVSRGLTPVSRAGYDGMRRFTQILARAEEQPQDVHYLNWAKGQPPGNEGYLASKPSGWDVRDHLSQGGTFQERVKYLNELLDKVEPIPPSWVEGVTAGHKAGSVEMDLLPCSSYQFLIEQWKKPGAMRWTDGLDRAMSFGLAVIVSTKAIGSQLWGKIIGPPSCGKSTLCEAWSVNKKYVIAKSTMRGFHSGYKTDKDGEEDNSLLAKVADKTLVTKDGDTLLQSPNLGQILSEARDVYDTTSRNEYRNKIARDYEGIRMTWILCGTSSLRLIDESELGERFLTCIIMDGIDDDLEDEILWRVINKTAVGMTYEADGRLETHNHPDMIKAMQLTGGYVDYLRKNANSLLKEIKFTDAARKLCVSLGKFTAFMRARPSKKQKEKAEREFGSRLVEQIGRLAMCTAVVLNKTEVDGEVMRRVRQVALDTSRGRTLQLIKHLYDEGKKGLETKQLAMYVVEKDEDVREMMNFLFKIGAVEVFKQQIAKGMSSIGKWRLTERMTKLYSTVMES